MKVREQREYDRWVEAVNITHNRRWQHVKDWIFRSPSGTFHDLVAANLNRLKVIEEKGLYQVKIK